MYQPPAFRETRLDVLHDLIGTHPFATLVTTSADGLTADHLPLFLDPNAGEYGTLRGHIAVANPLAKAGPEPFDALAIFQGPHAYVTPSWYPSKAEHGKVVPTWNYAVVHAHGPARLMRNDDWLRQLLKDLTTQHEADRPAPWSVDDAPADYVTRQLKGIVGVEIPLQRLEGKWKMSQNKSAADRRGVAAGLGADAAPAAQKVADLIQGTER